MKQKNLWVQKLLGFRNILSKEFQVTQTIESKIVSVLKNVGSNKSLMKKKMDPNKFRDKIPAYPCHTRGTRSPPAKFKMAARGPKMADGVWSF